jgi:protein-L-isoaspartate(D-aspartate) O-methyltransferase
MIDYTAARDNMVDGQLRPTKVVDPRVLGAMRELPRERFLPAALAPLAYIDGDLKLSATRSEISPLVLARLIQLAMPRAGETALVVGSAGGYGAAVLAACGLEVTALEEDADLHAIAVHALAGTAGVHPVYGKLAEGWAQSGPFDLVLIQGSVRDIPERIGRQVAQTGRLVAVLSPSTGVSTAVIAEPTQGGLAVRPAFDAHAPRLPSLWPAPSFVF